MTSDGKQNPAKAERVGGEGWKRRDRISIVWLLEFNTAAATAP
jgi:hypothetical protein